MLTISTTSFSRPLSLVERFGFCYPLCVRSSLAPESVLQIPGSLTPLRFDVLHHLSNQTLADPAAEACRCWTAKPQRFWNEPRSLPLPRAGYSLQRSPDHDGQPVRQNIVRIRCAAIAEGLHALNRLHNIARVNRCNNQMTIDAGL